MIHFGHFPALKWNLSWLNRLIVDFQSSDETGIVGLGFRLVYSPRLRRLLGALPLQANEARASVTFTLYIVLFIRFFS